MRPLLRLRAMELLSSRRANLMPGFAFRASLGTGLFWMSGNLFALLFGGFLSLHQGSTYAAALTNSPIRFAEMSNVVVTSGFWLSRLETNRTATLPHLISMCEQTG